MKQFSSRKGCALPIIQIAALDLARTGRMITSEVICAALGGTIKSANNVLAAMHNAGRLRRVARGQYMGVE